MSLRQEADVDKQRFYRIYGVAFAAWFSALFFIVLLGVAIYPVERVKTVTTLYHLVNFVAFALLAVLMWPTMAVKYFEISAPDLLFGGSTSASSSLIGGQSGNARGVYDAI